MHHARILPILVSVSVAACSAWPPADAGSPAPGGPSAARVGTTVVPAPETPAPAATEDDVVVEVVDAEELFLVQTPDWFVADAQPPALHRADFEPPDLLALTYDEEWSDPLIDLIQVARGQTRVVVLARPDEIDDPVYRQWLARHGAEVLIASHDTPWIRDYGPLQLVDELGQTTWVDFEYSVERPDDDAFPPLLAKHFDTNIVSYPVVVDGGALISNGRGLCAMTMASFDETSIAPDDPEGVQALLAALGCRALAVVPFLDDEETGHADVFAQFVAPDTVVVASVSPAIDRRHTVVLDRAVRTLTGAAAAIGQPLTVHRIPMMVDGDLFFTYVNGVRLRGGFLVPRYYAVDAGIELAAYRGLDSALGGIPLFPIDADAMVHRGGALHCLALGLGRPPQHPHAVAGRPRASDQARRL